MRQERRYPVAPACPHRSRRQCRITRPLPWVLTTRRCFDHGCPTQALSQWTAKRWSASCEVPPWSAAASVDPLPSFRARQQLRHSGLPLGPALRTSFSTNPVGQLFAGIIACMADFGFLEPFVIGLRNTVLHWLPCATAGQFEDLPVPVHCIAACRRSRTPQRPASPHQRRHGRCCPQPHGRFRHFGRGVVSWLNCPARSHRSQTLRLMPHCIRCMAYGESGRATSPRPTLSPGYTPNAGLAHPAETNGGRHPSWDQSQWTRSSS